MARLVVVSGPSGAGKTSVVAGALRDHPEIALPVSATTRPARPGEVDGIHYRFLTSEEFAHAEAAGEFLETAWVHGARYGTPRASVDAHLAEGRTVVLEIDVQGARSVRAAVPSAVLVFVEPPTPETLRVRLEGRATEDPDVVEQRLRNAVGELAAADEFEHRIVNDDLQDAIQRLIRILEAT